MAKVLEVVYLENTTQGHNKFYLMKQASVSEWEAIYGKIGAKGVTKKYSMTEWYQKKDEKLKKGYVNKTAWWLQTHGGSTKKTKKVVVNNTHLERVNLILLFIKNFPDELGHRSGQFLRDVNAVKDSLLESGELSKDEMKYLNGVWIKLSEKLGDLNVLRLKLNKL